MLRTLLPLTALALTAAATPPQGQSAGDAARGVVKRQLESVRAPMFNAGNALPGVTATYSVTTTGCTTRIDIAFPSHSVGGTSFAARTEPVSIDWNKARAITLSGAYVVVVAPGLPDKGRYFYAGSPDGAARLQAAMDTVTGACFGPAANTPPTSVAAVAERVYEQPNVLGTPQCRFRQVPELLLTDNKPPVVKTAVWAQPSREAPNDKDLKLSFGAQSGEQIANWDGILASSIAFRLHSADFRPAKITRAEVLLDDRDAGLPIYIGHQKSFDGTFSSFAQISPEYVGEEGDWMRRIAAASSATVRVYAGGRRVGQWTFDVSRLRLVPQALKGARWTCA